MSEFWEKILSFVYGAICGRGAGCLVASLFGSYVLGLIVGTIVLMVARRFWSFCGKHRTVGGSVWQLHPPTSENLGRGTCEPRPMFYEQSLVSQYQSASGAFDSPVQSCGMPVDPMLVNGRNYTDARFPSFANRWD